MKEFLQGVLGVAMFLAMAVFGLAQVIVAGMWLDESIGLWAIAVMAVVFFLRFFLLIGVGAFFGALEVLEWHWALAALFAAPTLLLIIPGLVGGALATLWSSVAAKQKGERQEP